MPVSWTQIRHFKNTFRVTLHYVKHICLVRKKKTIETGLGSFVSKVDCSHNLTNKILRPK